MERKRYDYTLKLSLSPVKDVSISSFFVALFCTLLLYLLDRVIGKCPDMCPDFFGVLNKYLVETLPYYFKLAFLILPLFKQEVV